ncbi:hypothetical protein [Emticicia sp. W12TSBA100-4]|uniref:hypothetical protein n=1 Tax=Emticicia sp. W12TSBA100-4 TaxID=3160965 RepID=UPI003305D284
MYFWIWNWIFVPSEKQKNLIYSLQQNNSSQSQKWFFIVVVLNLFPFIIASIIERILHSDNFLCFLNNGSIPILSFGILATNFFYLIENVPENDPEYREIYENMKLKVTVVTIILLFISTILYIFQSNFINYFLPQYYTLSIVISTVILIYSVSGGRKMFLLQNKFLLDFATTIDVTKKQLDDNNDGYQS